LYLNIKLTLQTQSFQTPPEGEIDYDVEGGGGSRQHEESMSKIYGVAKLVYSLFSQQKTSHLIQAAVGCANTKRWTSAAEVLTKI